jgi:disulfide bond formation protein DsbB
MMMLARAVKMIMVNLRKNLTLFLFFMGFLVSIGVLAFTFFLEINSHLVPCSLCIFQRVFLILSALIFLIFLGHFFFSWLLVFKSSKLSGTLITKASITNPGANPGANPEVNPEVSLGVSLGVNPGGNLESTFSGPNLSESSPSEFGVLDLAEFPEGNDIQRSGMSFRTVIIYALLGFFVALIGLAFSLRQIYLQSLPPSLVPGCGPGLNFLFKAYPFLDALKIILQGSGDCAKIDWRALGLSLADWAGMYFVLLMILNVVVIGVTKTKSQEAKKISKNA